MSERFFLGRKEIFCRPRKNILPAGEIFFAGRQNLSAKPKNINRYITVIYEESGKTCFFALMAVCDRTGKLLAFIGIPMIDSLQTIWT